LIALVSLPAFAADAQLETILVAVKKLNGKVEVAKVGKMDHVTIHLSFKGMLQIHRLYLQNTTITDEGLANLSGLENLEILSLNKTKITDAGLKNLVGLSNLKTLSLSNTKVKTKGWSR